MSLVDGDFTERICNVRIGVANGAEIYWINDQYCFLSGSRSCIRCAVTGDVDPEPGLRWQSTVPMVN